MSAAVKCDRCGALFDKMDGGHIVLDVQIQSGRDREAYDNWTDVDFCRKCGEIVIDAIGPAIILDTKPKRKKSKP